MTFHFLVRVAWVLFWEAPHFENKFPARETERHRVDQGKKKKKKMDGGWWMVDILSLMLYTKFGCHPPTHPPSTVLLIISRIKLIMDQLR